MIFPLLLFLPVGVCLSAALPTVVLIGFSSAGAGVSAPVNTYGQGSFKGKFHKLHEPYLGQRSFGTVYLYTGILPPVDATAVFNRHTCNCRCLFFTSCGISLLSVDDHIWCIATP